MEFVVSTHDNLETVGELGVPSRSQQVLESLSLEWGESHISDIESQLCDTLSIVKILLVLAGITSVVAFVVHINVEVGRIMLELLDDLLLGSQFVFEGVSRSDLLVLWDTGIHFLTSAVDVRVGPSNSSGGANQGIQSGWLSCREHFCY